MDYIKEDGIIYKVTETKEITDLDALKAELVEVEAEKEPSDEELMEYGRSIHPYYIKDEIAAGFIETITEIEKDTWIDMCEHANDEYAIDYDSDMYWSFLDVNPNTTRILKKFTIADYNDAYVVEFPQYTRDDGNACLESALRLCEKLQKKLEEEKTKI